MNKFLTLLFLLFSSSFAWSQAFAPDLSGAQTTISVDASTSNANGTLTVPASAGYYQVRLYNACPSTAFIKFGGIATVNDMPLPSGAIEVITIHSVFSTVGVILSSGSGCKVYFTLGRGI